MGQLDVSIIDDLPGFVQGEQYTISKAERIKTERLSFDGVRVVAKTKKGEDHAEMLWFRDRVGARTKLGAFVTEFGTDTNAWLGKKFEVVTWTEGNREITALTR